MPEEFFKPGVRVKLESLQARLEGLEERIAGPGLHGDPQEAARVAREAAALRRVVDPWRRLKEGLDRLEEAREILQAADGPEMRQLAGEEEERLLAECRLLATGILDSMLADPADASRAVILEVRAGTGGEEAALFVMDLCRAYARYAEEKGWKVETLAVSRTEMGGAREAILSVSGQEAYTRLRFEGGGHRVQRVPATEAQGRIHTSAATVAVLAEAEEVDLALSERDLRIDTLRSGGAGGQHVNKTESAVRITHLPTGLSVLCQDERSQHKNRARAMTILRSRLYDMEKRRIDQERARARRQQVGTGDRTDRVRTYNFPQNRVTDHRIHQNFPLDRVMEGRLDPIIDGLLALERERRLEEI